MNYFFIASIIFILLSNTRGETTESNVENSTLSDSNTAKAKGRTLFGLLGFLTGYRLGQGIGPTSYHSDFKESAQFAQLNFFGKLFNTALYFTYEKYPYLNNYAYPHMAFNGMMPYPQYPPIGQNMYPTNFQPPLWYPPLYAPFIIPPGHNPTNQQQIVNIHEPLNPNEAPNENYQETYDHNSQGIHNNFDSNNIANAAEPIDKIDINTTVEPSNVTDSKKVGCEGSYCIEANELDTENQTETTTEYPDIKNNSVVIEDNISQSSMDSNVTEVPKNHSYVNYKYPYPVYHYYENASSYEHISITEKPNNEMNFLKKPHHYQESDFIYDNYLPKLEKDVPFADVNKESVFHPMGGNYYESGTGYTDYVERFNKKQEDSDFVPIHGSNYI